MQRKQWTHEQRSEALDLLAQVGKAEASRRTGIPEGTIASWGVRHGVSGTVDPTRVLQVETKALTMQERKQALAADLGTLAAKAVARLAERIERDDASAKDLVAALTAAVDRMQLLTGEATSRTETGTYDPATIHEEALAVVRELRGVA